MLQLVLVLALVLLVCAGTTWDSVVGASDLTPTSLSLSHPPVIHGGPPWRPRLPVGGDITAYQPLPCCSCNFPQLCWVLWIPSPLASAPLRRLSVKWQHWKLNVPLPWITPILRGSSSPWPQVYTHTHTHTPFVTFPTAPSTLASAFLLARTLLLPPPALGWRLGTPGSLELGRHLTLLWASSWLCVWVSLCLSTLLILVSISLSFCYSAGSLFHWFEKTTGSRFESHL